MNGNNNVSRDDVLKKLKMKLVATVGTKGTIRGCTLNETIDLFRRDWNENIYDYVKFLKYGNLQDMIVGELSGAVRIARDADNVVRLRAIASPDLEHCFRFIDHPQPRRNPFTTSIHFPLDQQKLLKGQSRFSRSQSRRPPPPPSPARSAASRIHVPIFSRRNSIDVGLDEKSSSARPSRQSSTSPSRSAVTHKEVWRKSKEEAEISPFYAQIFESMTTGRNKGRAAAPFMMEIEKSRNVNVAMLDTVNKSSYASDDELLNDLNKHYAQTEEVNAAEESKKRMEEMDRQIRENFFRFEELDI